MQRKRNRVLTSDNIELGANIIPVSKGLMRKLKMKSLIKYAIVGIICFMVFSVYEKINLVSMLFIFISFHTLTYFKLNILSGIIRFIYTFVITAAVKGDHSILPFIHPCIY